MQMDYTLLTRAAAIREYKEIAQLVYEPNRGISYSSFVNKKERLIDYARKIKDYFNL